MSTATVDSRLYAVPPPNRQERLGLLLRMRRAARRALDAVLALPRAAAGWVLRHTRTVLSALADNPTLARLGARLSGIGSVIRARRTMDSDRRHPEHPGRLAGHHPRRTLGWLQAHRGRLRDLALDPGHALQVRTERRPHRPGN